MLNLFSFFKTAKAAPKRRPSRSTSIRDGLPRTAAEWERERGPQREQDLVLSDQVLVWLNQLPQPLRPSALCSQYPRVANRIALCWSDPFLTEQVFEALLLSQRGKRRGFPPSVASELMRLRMFHARNKTLRNGVRMWDPTLLAVSDRGAHR